jgi:hypothetical protein
MEETTDEPIRKPSPKWQPYHADYSTNPKGLAQCDGLEPKNHRKDDSSEVP